MVQAMATAAEIQARLRGVAGLIQEVMADWKVPGAAVDIVVGGQVLYQHAFGLRNVERSLPVRRRTLFAIGSCT
jgi:CubicO group peptidase (beta-lactamase class C family)